MASTSTRWKRPIGPRVFLTGPNTGVVTHRFGLKMTASLMHGRLALGDVVYFDETKEPKRGDWVLLREKDGRQRLVQFAHRYRGVRYVDVWSFDDYKRRPLDDGEEVKAVAFELRREL